MKRSTWEGRSVAWRYGCPAGTDIGGAAVAQLRLAHELHNELVAIWRHHQDRVAEAWGTCPEVSNAEAAVGDAEERVLAATAAVKAAKQASRTRRVVGAERDALVEARAALRAARAARRQAKGAALGQLSDTFRTLTAESRAARKATYATFVQERGLYWATYNRTLAQHDVAVQAVARARAEGKPGALRFARWTGEGSIAVQLQRQADKPARSPALLASDASPWRNVVRLPWIDPERWAAMTRPEQRRARLVEVAVRIGSDEHRAPVWACLPVIAHRPLPADADVTDVCITRRRVAGKVRCSVEISVRLPRPDARAPGARLAVNPGWRSMGDGSVRVAVWEGTGPMATYVAPQVPEGWVLAGPGGRSGELRVPPRWMDGMAGVAKLRSQRDLALDALRALLVRGLLAAPELATAWDLQATDVARWRSPARFASLALRHRDGPGDLPAALEAWRHQDRRLWEREANTRNQLIAQRNDVYRKTAAALADAFATVVTTEPFVGAVKRVQHNDSEQAAAARTYAQAVAPATFVTALASAVAGRGGTLDLRDAAWATRAHHGCGALLDAGETARSVRVTCPGCGDRVDQDRNHVLNLLDRSAR